MMLRLLAEPQLGKQASCHSTAENGNPDWLRGIALLSSADPTANIARFAVESAG